MPTTRTDGERTTRDARRAFPVIDRLLIVAIALELATTPILPALPLVAFGLAFVTPLRRSRWRMVTVGAVAVALTLLVVVPIIVTRLGIGQIVQLGPVHRAN